MKFIFDQTAHHTFNFCMCALIVGIAIIVLLTVRKRRLPAAAGALIAMLVVFNGLNLLFSTVGSSWADQPVASDKVMAQRTYDFESGKQYIVADYAASAAADVRFSNPHIITDEYGESYLDVTFLQGTKATPLKLSHVRYNFVPSGPTLISLNLQASGLSTQYSRYRETVGGCDYQVVNLAITCRRTSTPTGTIDPDTMRLTGLDRMANDGGAETVVTLTKTAYDQLSGDSGKV